MRIIVSIAFLLSLFSCQSKKTKSNQEIFEEVLDEGIIETAESGMDKKNENTLQFKEGAFRLDVSSNYGDKRVILIDNVSEEQIKEELNKINWGNYHIITLQNKANEIFAISGLLEDDGTTPPGILVEIDKNEGKEIFTLKNEPKSNPDIIKAALLYYNQDRDLMSNFKEGY